MNREITDKITQYSFVKNNLYKDFYVIEEEDKGCFVDTSDDKPTFEKAVYNKFKSIGTMGKNGPMNHIGERAYFRIYYHNDGLVELLFENSGHVDEVKDFKHLMYLLDPKNLDLKNEI
jgi:hypothetical protein